MARRQRNKEPSKLGAHIMVGVIVLLMVASMGSIMLYAPSYSDELTYGDIEFGVENNFYVANNREFSNLPFRALTVPVDQEAINILKTSPQIVMTFNPQDEENIEAIDFVRFTLVDNIPNIGGALTQESSEYSLPIMSCADATPMQPVLYIYTAPKPAIFHEGYCVILQGNVSSLVLAKDALLYNYFDMFLPQDVAFLQAPTTEHAEYLNATVQ